MTLHQVAELSALRIVQDAEMPVHPHGCGAAHLLAYNKKWSAEIRKQDPTYFSKLSEGQNPEFLYIGCCDSRVVPTEMMGLLPGEAFVHRSIAGLVCKEDCNILAAAQYAVHHLHVHTIIVAGHHRCGGIAAVYQGGKLGFAESYLDELVRLKKRYKKRVEAEAKGGKVGRMDCFAELSVIHQAKNLAETEIIQSIWREERAVEWERRLHQDPVANNNSPAQPEDSPTGRFPYVVSPTLNPCTPASHAGTNMVRNSASPPFGSPATPGRRKNFLVKLGKNPKKTNVQTVEVLAWILVLPSGVVRPLLKLDCHTKDLEADVEQAVEAVFERYRRPPDHPHTVYDEDGNPIEEALDGMPELEGVEEDLEESNDDDDDVEEEDSQHLQGDDALQSEQQKLKSETTNSYPHREGGAEEEENWSRSTSRNFNDKSMTLVDCVSKSPTSGAEDDRQRMSDSMRVPLAGRGALLPKIFEDTL